MVKLLLLTMLILSGACAWLSTAWSTVSVTPTPVLSPWVDLTPTHVITHYASLDDVIATIETMDDRWSVTHGQAVYVLKYIPTETEAELKKRFDEHFTQGDWRVHVLGEDEGYCYRGGAASLLVYYPYKKRSDLNVFVRVPSPYYTC